MVRPFSPNACKRGWERPSLRLAIDVAIGVVTYLADSGYTITMVLNFGDHRMTGFASSAEEWMPVKGTFEVVG